MKYLSVPVFVLFTIYSPLELTRLILNYLIDFRPLPTWWGEEVTRLDLYWELGMIWFLYLAAIALLWFVLAHVEIRKKGGRS